MYELSCCDEELYTRASEAISRRETVVVRVAGKLASAVASAMRLHSEYFDQKSRGKKNVLLLLKYGWYGIRTPSLWAVLNKADLVGAQITTSRDGRELVIRIAPWT